METIIQRREIEKLHNANKRKIYSADRAQTVFQDNIAKRGNRQSAAAK